MQAEGKDVNLLKHLSSKQPLAFGLVITMGFIVMLVIAAVLGNLWPGDSAYGQPGGIAGRIVAAAILFGLLASLGWLHSAGMLSLGSGLTWLWLLLLLAYAVLALTYVMSGAFNLTLFDQSLTGLVILFILIAALLEEITFRGLILHGLVRAWGTNGRGLMLSVVASALLFCSIHLLDFLGGRPLLNVLLQSLQAFFLGIFLAALVVRGKSIYPSVIFHAVLNLAAFKAFASKGLEPDPTSWWLLSLAILPLAVVGIFLLRSLQKAAITLPGNG